MRTGRSLVALATELQRQLATKRDMIVPTGLMQHQTTADGSTSIRVDTPDGAQTYPTTQLFRRQLADKLKIPFAYFERMRTEQALLLDRNVDTWLHQETEQRMVRTLDGQARAFLSDRYRRLDNYDLCEHVLPILQRLPEARFESCELTPTRLYLKVVTPRVQIEIQPSDIVQAGVVISNSEVGQGTLSVQPLIYRLLCRNGLIAVDRSMHKTHLGRMNDVSNVEVTVFRDDTLRAEDQAFFLKVRDVVEAAVSEVTLQQVAEKMRRTIGIRLMGDPAKAIEVIGTRYLLNEGERSGVLRHLIEGGDLSAYGLVNAVTHFAQDVDDYDRATEFEALGGRLIEQSTAEWEAVAQAA
jgi:hypothetical protein